MERGKGGDHVEGYNAVRQVKCEDEWTGQSLATLAFRLTHW